MIQIGSLRMRLVMAFCYENRLELVNDCSMLLHRDLDYSAKQSMTKGGYGEMYTLNDSPSQYKCPTDFHRTHTEGGSND